MTGQGAADLRQTPNCATIPARALWRALKKTSKTVSRKSSRFWRKLKSCVKSDHDEMEAVQISKNDESSSGLPTRTPHKVDHAEHNLLIRRPRPSSRRDGSLYMVTEEEGKDNIPKFPPPALPSHAVSSPNDSSTARDFDSGLKLEPQCGLDSEEAVNNSRQKSESAGRFYAGSPDNQERSVSSDTETKGSDVILHPAYLNVDDIPSDEPVAVARTPIMDWANFDCLSEDSTVASYQGSEPETEATKMKMEKSWWSSWTRSSKKSSEISSQSSCDGETYRFGEQRSEKSVLDSFRNVLSGESRFGYQAPISVTIKKRGLNNRKTDFEVPDTVGPRSVVRSYAQLCEAIREKDFASSTSAPAISASMHNSTFSSGTRCGNAINGVTPRAALSTAQVTRRSDKGSYDTVKSRDSSRISLLASETINSAAAHKFTFSVPGHSSGTEKVDNSPSSISNPDAGCSTDGSSDFGEFVCFTELPDSIAKVETRNPARTVARKSSNTESKSSTYGSRFCTVITAANPFT